MSMPFTQTATTSVDARSRSSWSSAHVERDAQVVELRREPRDPRELVGGAEVRAGLLGEGAVVRRVPAPDRVGLARLFEAVLRVLPDRLEQPVARLFTDLVGDDQRPTHERREVVEHVERVDAFARGDGFRRVEGAPAREDRETLQHACARRR